MMMNNVLAVTHAGWVGVVTFTAVARAPLASSRTNEYHAQHSRYNFIKMTLSETVAVLKYIIKKCISTKLFMVHQTDLIGGFVLATSD